ncbi:MAG: hypothetical protein JEZ11_28485 [Desulfobacterales bacterium]|nr:hypothetical protein [Desulfobacterales bacterium]
MQYRIITVINLGYASPDTASPDVNPVEIWGLDNRDGEKFAHIGYDYPPELDAVTIHMQIEKGDPTGDLICFIAYEGETLTIGEDVSDPIAVLIADFGWSEETFLNGKGLPEVPEE